MGLFGDSEKKALEKAKALKHKMFAARGELEYFEPKVQA